MKRSTAVSLTRKALTAATPLRERALLWIAFEEAYEDLVEWADNELEQSPEREAEMRKLDRSLIALGKAVAKVKREIIDL